MIAKARGKAPYGFRVRRKRKKGYEYLSNPTANKIWIVHVIMAEVFWTSEDAEGAIKELFDPSGAKVIPVFLVRKKKRVRLLNG